VFAACALLTLMPLWRGKHLPMVDLPQHASLIFIWQHLSDPYYGFSRYFELHYFTPYLVTYSVTRFLATWMSVWVALKVVVTLAVWAVPLSLLPFFKRVGVSRWWSLLGFPLAFGVSFSWGFLSFMVGIPVAFLYLALTIDYAREPSGGRAVLISLLTLALFWIHGVLLAWCPVVSFAILAQHTRGLTTLARRLLPFVVPLPILVVWFAMDRHIDNSLFWYIGPYRLYGLFAMAGEAPKAFACGFIALTGAIILLRDRRPERRPVLNWVPFAITTSYVLFWPICAMGVVHIAERFNIFVLPLMIAWLRPRATVPLRASLIAGTAVMMAVLTVHFAAFNREARDFEEVAAAIPAQPRVRPLVWRYEPRDLPFLHFPAWTQVEKGGLYGFSFAVNHPVVRFKAGAPTMMVSDDEWWPEHFDWRREAPVQYDTFVVRSKESGGVLTQRLFPGAGDAVGLVAEKGLWHVYRARPAALAAAAAVGTIDKKATASRAP
jgi:hypothetical protein